MVDPVKVDLTTLPRHEPESGLGSAGRPLLAEWRELVHSLHDGQLQDRLGDGEGHNSNGLALAEATPCVPL